MKINHVDSDDQFTHLYYVQTDQIIYMKYEVFCIRTVLVSLLATFISLLYIWVSSTYLLYLYIYKIHK